MSTANITQKKVSFISEGLKLKGILYQKANDGQTPAVIVCHPHPQYGGSMDNNVVNCVCEHIAAEGLMAFKFNFRGVDDSEGVFDNGRGEQADVKAALEFLLTLPGVDNQRSGLVGYSAGSAWGLQALCTDSRIKAMAAISAPLDMFDFGFLKNCRKPLLFISGSRDRLSPAGQIKEICAEKNDLFSYQIVDEADHIWSGCEDLLGRSVTRYFTTHTGFLTKPADK